MNTSKIEWTDVTWNPVTGCTPVSPGCFNCYAKRMANRLRGRFGYPIDHPFKVTLHPDKLDKFSLKNWRREKPKRIFVCSMGDLFHEDVPDDFILNVFDRAVVSHPLNRFILLTKRPKRMGDVIFKFLDIAGVPVLSKKFWVGTSIEDKITADDRIQHILDIPAQVRILSVEPMLGPINLELDLFTTGRDQVDKKLDTHMKHFVNWIICGGESGPGARPMKAEWARSIRDQCRDVNIPFFFKQWGEHNSQGVRVGKKAAGRELDGKIYDEYPGIKEKP